MAKMVEYCFNCDCGESRSDVSTSIKESVEYMRSRGWQIARDKTQCAGYKCVCPECVQQPPQESKEE